MLDIENLDTGALSKSYSITELWRETKERHFKTSSKFITIFVCIGYVLLATISAGILFVMLGMVLSSTPELSFIPASDQRILAICITAVILLCIGCILLVSAFGNAKKRLRNTNFAKDNNAKYLEGRFQDEPGIMFLVGDDRAYDGGFEFSGKENITVMNGKYILNKGNKNQVTCRFGVIKFRVSRKLPNTIFDTLSNNSSLGSNLGIIAKHQELQLEGDFNKYFKVYSPVGYERDTLYWLTPELMLLLQENFSAYDIEIIDDIVYLYTPHFFKDFNAQNVVEALRIGKRLYLEFEQNTRKYVDNRSTNMNTDRHTIQENIVAVPGRRLIHRKSKITILLIILFFGFLALSALR